MVDALQIFFKGIRLASVSKLGRFGEHQLLGRPLTVNP